VTLSISFYYKNWKLPYARQNLWENKYVNDVGLNYYYIILYPRRSQQSYAANKYFEYRFYNLLPRSSTRKYIRKYIFLLYAWTFTSHYEWKVAAIWFARKTGLYDRNRSSPLQLADFTNFQVFVEKWFDIIYVESTLYTGLSGKFVPTNLYNLINVY